MGSEAAPSPRDACLRIALDAKSLYSNIHAALVWYLDPTYLQPTSRRAACISQHDGSLHLTVLQNQ
jgi:hypothetical protein